LEELIVFIPKCCSSFKKTSSPCSSCLCSQLLLKLWKESTSRGEVCSPNDVCFVNDPSPLLYSEIGSVWHQQKGKPAKTALAWWHATVRGGRAQAAAVGCGRTLSVSAPRWGWLATSFAWTILGLAWAPLAVVSQPRCFMKVGFFIFFVCAFLEYAFCFVLSLMFSCISTCFRSLSCKTCFLGIQVELG
jgi:hypothetical protein